MRKVLLIGSVCVLLAVLVAGCGGGAAKGDDGTPEATVPAHQPGGQVLRLLGSDPPTLDPHLATDATSATYIDEIFSGLVTINRNLEVVPEIAKSWDIGGNGTVYTFHLRDDVYFSNRRPVTAHDFKWSMERACDPKTGSVVADTYLGDIVGCRDKLNGKAKEVAGVKVLDDYTFELTIDAPRHYFIAKLTYTTAHVLLKENVETDSPGHPWTDNPVGTGPFMLDKYVQGEEIVLVPNPFYYGEPKPRLRRIEFDLAGGTPIVLYERDELDVAGIGLQDLDRVTNPSEPLFQHLTIVKELSTSYIAFNVDQPPFDDPKVREAFVRAVDLDKIIKVVVMGAVERAKGILPPNMPGYDPNVQALTYDPARARELIAESKYGSVANLPEITLAVSGGGGAPPASLEAILEQWRQNLGIEVIYHQERSYVIFLQNVAQHPNPYQMFTLGWIADYPDPQDFLEILFHGESLDNHTGYNSPVVNDLLDRAATEPNEAKRIALYQEAERQIIKDCVWLTIAHGKSYTLTKPWVKGLIQPSMVIPRFKYVWIER